MKPVTALVLSGGGVRGAYQVGVVAGLLDLLGPRAEPLFDLFVGTSIGAINASALVAGAHRRDLGIDELSRTWSELDLGQMLRVELFGARRFARLPWSRSRQGPEEAPPGLGTALLDPAPIDRVVCDRIRWPRLQANIDEGRVRGLVLPALDIHDGRTTMFAHLAPGATYQPSPDPRRRVLPTRIDAAHVLASAAIPVLFPPRQVGGRWYVDGGLRFNTPLAPAIRAGADRLVVVSTLGTEPPRPEPDGAPGLLFLAGKVLNALLLDPLDYDLQVLRRLNELVAVVDAELRKDAADRVHEVLEGNRGAPYRWLDTLVFRPSVDIGRLALEHIQDRLENDRALPGHLRWMLTRAVAGRRPTAEADWASFVLFDGPLARRLIALGRADVLAKADEVRAFFGSPDALVADAG